MNRMTAPGLVLDEDGLAAVVQGVSYPLGRAQFVLLTALAERPGRVRTRGELGALCGVGGTRNVDVVVHRLRRALGPHGQRIETVRRRGYRLT